MANEKKRDHTRRRAGAAVLKGGLMTTAPGGSAISRAIDHLEESVIALILGLMTIITFANVIARYIFNSNILWALEATVFLFAWLVLIGMSYCVKHSSHLGVDVLITGLSQRGRKICALLAVAACLAYSILLLKGSWDYWYAFATKRAFLETNDVPMPEFLQFFADWLNEGERYEKLPRFIPYFALPLGLALLTFRFLQAGYDIIIGRRDRLIAGHEGEDEIEAAEKEPEPDDPPPPALPREG